MLWHDLCLIKFCIFVNTLIVYIFMMLKLSFLNRFLLFVFLIIAGLSKGYSQNDFDEPILSNYTVTPSSVDISSGTQTLTLNITASDASGVNFFT